MLMSRLRTDTRTHGNVKVEQYSAEAESAKMRSTAFLLQNFVNTRSSVAFKDMLWSSIAPQTVLH